MRSWSRSRTLGLGIVLILLTNTIALGGVWWNRSAAPESALNLSERELSLPQRSLRLMENSGLALNLNWRVAGREAGEFDSGYTLNGGRPEWLDVAKMAALGFPIDAAHAQHYLHELPREVILVMELAGPAWQRALEKARENASRHAAAAAANVGNKEFAARAMGASNKLAREENSNSRLFVIDAGLDARLLREKYPDRNRFLLLRGTVRPTMYIREHKTPQAIGYVSHVSNGQIHVPHALREPLDSLRAQGEPGGGDRFTATLLVGQRLEPWLVEVKLTAKAGN
jgi:hypothetical protein